ncbi:MAG: class I SAM-dependent methyltransferase [Candidatus Tectimicrobiota bacterium]
MNEPLRHLPYFTAWGGKSWAGLVRLAIDHLQQHRTLEGAQVLDIGTRYGEMAVLFSLLGARATGIDLHERPLVTAREEASKWGVSARTQFLVYNGDLDLFPDKHFDIIFTKSVLVLVPNLEAFLKQIAKKLKPNGHVVFIENAQGSLLSQALRAIKYRYINYGKVHHLTEADIAMMRTTFQIDLLKRTAFPPVYLFLGRRPV